MPVQMNILENEVLGREYNRGTHEGKVTALGPLLEKRFGPTREDLLK